MKELDTISLPEPRHGSGVSVEGTLGERRSVREFADEPLGLDVLSQLLWAAQGRTSPEGGRAAPSAGALYPLEIDTVVGRVRDLEPGVYRYRAGGHDLRLVARGDCRTPLARAALEQHWMAAAPVAMAIVAVERRTARKYGERAPLYVALEAGCAAQNAALQAVALGLGTCVIGAFAEDTVAELLRLRPGERPLALMSFGRGRP